MGFLNKKYLYSKLTFNLAQLFYAIFYWNVAIRLALFMQALGYKTHGLSDGLTKGMAYMHERVFAASIIISIFAIISWSIQFHIYPKLFRKFNFNRVTFVIALLDIITFVLIGVLLGVVHYAIEKGFDITEIRYKLGDFLLNSTILFFFIVMFLCSYVYQLITTLFRQIGFGRLGRVMMGYYQKPREENLIFMFLDLQSSTSFAEKLGHEKYSYFIQDCFRLISSPLLMTRGRVYQFVGDEVVITWDASKAKNYKKAVDFFFLFTKELEQHKAHFEKKYGLIPIFSASLNAGKVMSAEVGEVKTELAYHGDVLNTAARIQKQCKPYEKPILVTEHFAEELKMHQNGYSISYVDNIMLSGKAKQVNLYEVVT